MFSLTTLEIILTIPCISFWRYFKYKYKYIPIFIQVTFIFYTWLLKTLILKSYQYVRSCLPCFLSVAARSRVCVCIHFWASDFNRLRFCYFCNTSHCFIFLSAVHLEFGIKRKGKRLALIFSQVVTQLSQAHLLNHFSS